MASPGILIVQDLALSGLHLAVIGINCLGWIHPSTRRLQRFVLLLTALSWFVLGATRGWGYCVLTDWQWDVKHSLGQGPLPPSYIHYLIHTVMGVPIEPFWTDVLTVSVFAAVVGITIGQVYRERKLKIP